MKKTTRRTRQRRMTRREFVGGAVAAAGVIAGAPAFLRGQNLNNKLNIAFIACGGRANASLSELTITPGRGGATAAGRGGGGAAAPAAPHPDENVIVLCDVNQDARRCRVPAFPAGQEVHRPPTRLRPPERLRRRRGVHGRAHARVRDLPGADARQARLLREAAHLQHLGSTAHPRDRREVSEALDADGQPGSRLGRAAHDQGNPDDRRHRSGARGPRLGGPRLGTAGCGVGREVRQTARVLQRHPDRRPVQGGDADPAGQPLRSVARTRAGAAVSRDVLPRSALVSLVGFRQRHDERPRQPRQRRAVHGAGHQDSR